MADLSASMSANLSCRRAVPDDALHVKLLFGEDFEAYDQRYGGNVHLKQVIETSHLSIVAVDDDDAGAIVGFAAFNDHPSVYLPAPLQKTDWVTWTHTHSPDVAKGKLPLTISNSLWLVFATARANHSYAAPTAIYNVILATLYTTLPDTDHLLFAMPSHAPLFPLLEDHFQILNTAPTATPPAGGSGQEDEDGSFLILHSSRQRIIPDLRIRKGRVEDYDDLMPLLLAEAGVMTEMGENFYLDELLEHQDAMHSVLVAEDAETGQIVGLMCLTSLPDDQQYVIKHFNFEAYQKLKRILPLDPAIQAALPSSLSTTTGGGGGKQFVNNSFTISFFYLNPDYECRAIDFLRVAFQQFLHAEYCVLRLPHSAPDHALLNKFQYVPLRQGLTLRLGCFVLCRYSLDELTAKRAAESDLPQLGQLLGSQTEISRTRCEQTLSLVKSCIVSQKGTSAATPASHSRHAFLFQHRSSPNGSAGVGVSGVVVVQEMDPVETHTVVSHFDVDSCVDFLAAMGSADGEWYRQTAVGVGPNGKPTTLNVAGSLQAAASADPLPACLILHFYIKPIFRTHIRLFLREALRHIKRALLFYAVGPEDEMSSSLICELTIALPRRQRMDVEKDAVVSPTAASPSHNTSGHPTIDFTNDKRALVVHFTSVRLLSEMKAKVHSRVVVVGASVCGLAFLYSLLATPHIHFSNVVLVSRDGIPEHASQCSYLWYADTMDFTEREYVLFFLKCKLRVIVGNLVDFERSEKYVVTDTGVVEPYDHLVITAGRQYTIPRDWWSSKQIANRSGVYVLSGKAQIDQIIAHVQNNHTEEDDGYSVVVYGHNLDAFCVVSSMIDLGVNPARIAIVDPSPPPLTAAQLAQQQALQQQGSQPTTPNASPKGAQMMLTTTSSSPKAGASAHGPSTTTSLFHDPAIDAKIERLCDTLGIRVFRHHVLDRLEGGEGGIPGSAGGMAVPQIVTAEADGSLNAKSGSGFLQPPQIRLPGSQNQQSPSSQQPGYTPVNAAFLTNLTALREQEEEAALGGGRPDGSALDGPLDGADTNSLWGTDGRPPTTGAASSQESDVGSVPVGGIRRSVVVEVPCSIFIYCDEKDIDPAILSALNKRSIVFDGRVIVENNYRTTDRNIYAAGPIAMFSRRFGPSEPFEAFRSSEVGRHLCGVVMGFMGVECSQLAAGGGAGAGGLGSALTGPTRAVQGMGGGDEEDEEGEEGAGKLTAEDREQLRRERRGQLFADEAPPQASEDGSVTNTGAVIRPKPLPQYSENLMWALVLPQGFNYFHCTMRQRARTTASGPRGPLTLAPAEANQIRRLATTNIRSEDDPSGDNYIHIAVDPEQYIQSISYLGSSPVEIDNLKVLVGLPQTYMNLIQRWRDGLIPDVLKMLRSEWAMAIFYDKFHAFVRGLRNKFRTQRDVQALTERVMGFVQEENVEAIDEQRRKGYASELTPETEHMVQLELIRFLHQNKRFLPIYFLPDISMHVY